MTTWRAAIGSVDVAIKAHPHARRAGVLGRVPDIDGERLRIGVTEPAEGGRANEAVCAALATALEVPRSAVALVSGATSRRKRVRVTGDAAELGRRLDAL